MVNFSWLLHVCFRLTCPFSLLQKNNYVISKICEVPTDKLERLVQVASMLKKATMGDALIWKNTTV